MNTSKKLIAIFLTALALFGAGFWVGRGETKVETRTVTVKGETVTKVVDHIVTVTKVIKPDGTVTEVTKTEDKDKWIKEKEETADKSKVTTPVLPNWGVGGGVVVKPLDGVATLIKRDYYGEVSRRLIGGVWVDLRVDTSRQIGLGVKLEF